MAGLGLTQAITAGINAERLRKQDDRDDAEYARVDKQRKLLEQANAAGSAELGDKPDGFSVMRAFDARGRVLLQGGDFESFMKNEGQAASARLKARAQALQQYQTDGDFEKFARSAFATIPNGEEIDKVEPVQGGQPGPNGAPAGPPQVRLTTTRGRVITQSPDAIVQGVRASLMDPVKTAEMEAKISLESTLARIKETAKAEGEIRVEQVKGDEKRKTEGVEQTNRLGLEAVRGANSARVAGINAGASKYAADQGLEGRKYAADKGAESAKARAASSGDKAMRDDALQRMVVNSGIGVIDPVTRQARGNEDSNKVALRARQWLEENPDMSELEAVNKAIGEYRQRKPAGLR